MKIIASLLWLTSAGLAQIPNVSGNWSITVTSTAFGGTFLISGELNQNVGALSGELNVSGYNCVPNGPFTGTISANGTMTLAGGPTQLAGVNALAFTGSIAADGNSVSGTWTGRTNGCTFGDDEGTWVGVRLAPVLTVAQIVDGSSWETEFQVVNLDTVPVTFSFAFWRDDGSPMALPIVKGTTGTFSGSLPVGGTAFAQTPGTAAGLMQGWANVISSGQIGVLAIFRQRIAGRPDSEGTVTGVQSGSEVFLPFDDANGYLTGVAIANANTTRPVSVTMLFTAANGTQTTGSLTLGRSAHTAFQITQPDMFPALLGVQGSIRFTASSPDITVVGLRFSPTNSFTSLGEFQPTPVSTSPGNIAADDASR